MCRHICLVFFIIFLLSLLLLNGGALAQDSIGITIFMDQDSFTVYVPSYEEIASLQNLQFEVVIDNKRTRYTLDVYKAFQGLYFNDLLTPLCLRLERGPAENPLPVECQNIPPERLITQSLSEGNVFWYDKNSRIGRLVLIMRGSTQIGLCPFQIGRCQIEYAPPTFTPTPVGAKPTSTLKSTDTPSAPVATATAVIPFPTATLTMTPPPQIFAAGTSPNWDLRVEKMRGITMVYVPSGCFVAGKWTIYEEHVVCMDAFWISMTEITNSQYLACVEAGVCGTTSAWIYAPDYVEYPVIQVTWYQANAYAEWAGGSLPTEAQWVYAAYGPAGYAYPWGDSFDGTKLNFCDHNCEEEWSHPDWNDGFEKFASVAHYPDGASWVGALDMAGNASEWVLDWHQEEYYNSLEDNVWNPPGPAGGMSRVLRGGSFIGGQTDVSAAHRGYGDPNMSDETIGFRMVIPAN